jgi:hypothetical protein
VLDAAESGNCNFNSTVREKRKTMGGKMNFPAKLFRKKRSRFASNEKFDQNLSDKCPEKIVSPGGLAAGFLNRTMGGYADVVRAEVRGCGGAPPSGDCY